MERLFQNKQIRDNLIVISFFFFFVNVFSQESNEYRLYKNKFPDSRKVRLNQETIITIKVIKGELKIKQEFIEEDLYLNESATYDSKNSIRFSSFFELEKIKASSFSFLKKKYREYKVENFIEKDELDQSFYDDTKILSFIYPNLTKGSKSRLQYSQIVKNPRFISTFYLGDFFPIINNKVTIIADKEVAIEFREFNIDKKRVKFSKEKKGQKILYKWELFNEDEYEFEENSPDYKKILPHIIPIIKTYKVKSKIKKVLGEVSDLYRWYYSLVKDVNKDTPSKELVTLVKNITSGKDTELEKVKAIYYWTQKNIKYIAFEYALGGFIPRESNDVFKKKYGDCKDNSSILFKMLEIAGIKGSLTWIGTRKIPYTYKEVPTPKVDNHMILSYENKGRTYFLDATGRYIKLGLPTSFIQGKEALISQGNEFKIEKVPIVAAKENAIIDSTKIKLLENNVIGSSKTSFSGYQKIDYYHNLEGKKSQSKLKEFYNKKRKKGNNKFLIDDLKEINKYHYDNDFKVNYTFKISDYYKKLGDEIYINLNLNKELSNFKVSKQRKTEIEFDYKKYYKFYTALDIPDGYKVDYLPGNVSTSDELSTLKITYQKKGNQIIYTHSIELNFLSLNLEEQKKMNEAIKKIEKNYKEIIVLKKI